MKVALDTNVLAYAEGTNGADRKRAALDLLQRMPGPSVVVPVQALGELFNVLVLKAKRPPADARDALLTWQDAYALIETSASVMLDASDLATNQGLRIWDSVMLAASAAAGCRLLLSEDLQDGFTWRGVTVTNPFAATRHPLLDALLPEGDDSPGR
jgi:predicted nucleic acid-binding protein